MTRRLIALSVTALTLSALGLTACGDDDDSADAERYCEILADLDEAGAEAFGQLDADATEAEYDEAQKEFVEDNRSRFNQLIDAAPASIRDDVRATVDAATEEGPADEEASARVTDFDEETCRGGAEE